MTTNQSDELKEYTISFSWNKLVFLSTYVRNQKKLEMLTTEVMLLLAQSNHTLVREIIEKVNGLKSYKNNGPNILSNMEYIEIDDVLGLLNTYLTKEDKDERN